MVYGEWPPYVPVAATRARATRSMKKLRRQGLDVEPVRIQGRKIARTFWGAAWCAHLEQFSDFANRLPRGRTYVRHGSVCHLAIGKGKVEAIVAGSALYRIGIRIAPLSSTRWEHMRRQCAGRIGSMLELLRGEFSNHVMEIVTEPVNGLFPGPADIDFDCDCPDWAVMCKHVAAVLYGVGARLDEKPELLFVLRRVDHQALISGELDVRLSNGGEGKRRRLVEQDLSDVFGIDIEDAPPPKRKAPPPDARRTISKKPGRKNKAAGRRPSTARRAKPIKEENAFAPTGASIARLRKRLRMTRVEFADRVGVCAQTVANWESKRGRLVLRKRTLTALTRALSAMRS